MFAFVAPSATAHGGGGGFSSGGDSGMNPFTGDSYAYFHGGRNLGEEGTIRPNRPAPWPQWHRGTKNSEPAAKKPANEATDVTAAPGDRAAQPSNATR